MTTKTLSEQLNKKLFAQCMNWLPGFDTQQTKSKVISEEIPYYYAWYNKRHTLILSQKPQSLPKNKVVNQKEMRHHLYIESYINPISQAKKYDKILKEERLNQAQLAQKIGVSRVRITQYLNLLKLPQEQQDYIIRHGKEKMITERKLRTISNRCAC